MKSNTGKRIIFILYSWLIYNLHAFFTAPTVIPKEGIGEFGEFLVATLGGVVLIIFLYKTTLLLWELHPLVVPIFLLIIILPALFWVRKQTLFRAWILALAGMFLGPGLFLYLPSRFTPAMENGVYAFIGINLLFITLFLGKFIWKIFCPANPFFNRIGAILKWPCINTDVLAGENKLDKLWKWLIFIAFSWIIYNMAIVLMAPVVIFEKGILVYVGEAIAILSGLFLAWLVYYGFDQSFAPENINLLFVYLLGLIPIFFWIRKQTVIRAWFLALGGACAGPGLWLFREEKYSFISAVIVLLLVNVFFAILTWVNYAQKKYWPNNGPCNRLRLMLREPCLNM